MRLTRDEVLGLQPSERQFSLRLVRLTNDGEVEIMRRREALYVQRAPASGLLPERLAVVAPAVTDWAEGSWQDVQSDGSVLVEDYKLELFW